MKHCPNPLCPHRVSTGETASYEDLVARCADCHATLHLGAAPVARSPHTPPTLRPPSGISPRVLITLGCAGAFGLALQGRVPGLSLAARHVPAEGFDEVTGSPFGAVIAGALVVALVGRLRAFKAYSQDRLLWGFSMAFALLSDALLATLARRQGFEWLWFALRRDAVVATLVVLGLARVMDRQGVVSGLPALLGVWALDGMVFQSERAQAQVAFGTLSGQTGILWGIALAAMAGLTLAALGGEQGMRARVLTAERVEDTAYRASPARVMEVLPGFCAPASAGDAVLVFPFVAMVLTFVARAVGWTLPDGLLSSPRHLGYCALYLTITLSAVAWFNARQHPTDEIARTLQRAAALPLTADLTGSVRAAVRSATGRSGLLVVILTALGWFQTIVTNGELGDASRYVLVFTAVILDAWEGIRAQRTLGASAMLRQETSLWAADLARAIVEAHEVPAVVVGRHLRAMHPMLVSTGAVQVAVPEARLDDAHTALELASLPRAPRSSMDVN